MALIADARSDSGGDSAAIGVISLHSPHLHTPSPPWALLPVPNKPYGFCGRYAPCLLTYAVLFILSNIALRPLTETVRTIQLGRREPVWPSGKALGW